jgi:DnaJ-class molecular chaperone
MKSNNNSNTPLEKENETKKERVCPRCHGKKVDPHHFQDDCQRCGGTGKVYGPESNFVPYPFVD